MSEPAYGQQGRMEDETMVSILEAQERVIWPLERPFLERLGVVEGGRVVDLGCGTGLVSARLASMGATEVQGIDLFEGHIRRARERFGDLSGLRFDTGDATASTLPGGSFDLVVSRCVLQAVRDPLPFLSEMIRLVRSDGWLHVLAEDYGLILASGCRDPQPFYLETVVPAVAASGSDLLVGRKVGGLLEGLGCREVTVDLLPVDTTHVDRDELAAVFRTWSAGYVDFVAAHSGRPVAEVAGAFEDQIAACRDRSTWFGWYLFVVQARPPDRKVTDEGS